MKKKFILILTCLFVASLFKAEDVNIKKEDIFTKNEDFYYVLIHLDSCIACRNVKMFINAKRFKEKVYYLDFQNCYCSGNGEQNNLNIQQYQELKIVTVPTFLFIKNKVVVNELIGQYQITHYPNY